LLSCMPHPGHAAATAVLFPREDRPWQDKDCRLAKNVLETEARLDSSRSLLAWQPRSALAAKPSALTWRYRQQARPLGTNGFATGFLYHHTLPNISTPKRTRYGQ
jgi:hypothetical protein